MGHPDYNLLAKLGRLPADKAREYETLKVENEALRTKLGEVVRELEELKKELAKKKK